MNLENQMTVHAVRITPENFIEFGKVVTAPRGKPTAEAESFRFWSDIADYSIRGETEIGICTVYRLPSSGISVVERHLQTPEILIPIDAPFILPLVGDDGTVSAFRVGIGEAVVIDKAIWHGPCLPVAEKESSYFVVFKKGTPHTDVEKKIIPETVIQYE
jgi:ureidoglycolate lyase